MLALTLILALMQPTGAREELRGTVAVMSRPFALDLETAQKLCPDGARLRILIGAEDPALVDPLGALGAPTSTLVIDADKTFAGDDMDLAKRATAASCIVLEGGTWSGWWRLLEPVNKRTRLGRVLLERHAAGGNVIGVGPAGVFLCEYGLLSRKQLQIPSRDPHDLREHVLVEGLGLVRGACFDFAMDGRTTVEPLFEALRASRVGQGVWLSGSCAWMQSGDGPLARIGGHDGAAYLFDLAAGRRSRDAIQGGRVARFTAGDRFEGLPKDRMRGTFRSESIPFESVPLDADLGTLPWLGPGDPKKSGNSRKAVEFRGKTGHLRLFPEPGTGTDVPPPAHSPRPDWIRFDWIPIASAGAETRVEPQIHRCFDACFVRGGRAGLALRGPAGHNGFEEGSSRVG